MPSFMLIVALPSLALGFMVPSLRRGELCKYLGYPLKERNLESVETCGVYAEINSGPAAHQRDVRNSLDFLSAFLELIIRGNKEWRN